MTDLVPADEIEAIVGVARHQSKHFARAVSAERKVYILHSQGCLDDEIDLRDCPYSLALDRGIDDIFVEDVPVHVTVGMDGDGWYLHPLEVL